MKSVWVVKSDMAGISQIWPVKIWPVKIWSVKPDRSEIRNQMFRSVHFGDNSSADYP